MPRHRDLLTYSLVSLLGVAVVALPLTAEARPTGEPQACGNCHYEKNGPTIEYTMSNPSPAPGETVTFRFKMTANPQVKDALRTGLWLQTNQKGEFGILEPNYMQMLNPTSILHKEPKNLVNGQAEFELAWTAPSEPGTAVFTAWSMTGNTNGTEADDHHTQLVFQLAWGCNAKYSYPDEDKDGYGDEKRGTLSCDAVVGLIDQGGDCNDREPTVNPGQAEICNVRDDDCDGTFDNGLMCGLVYPDADGDGFGDRNGAQVYGGGAGFATNNMDCDDTDAAVYPGATEMVNGKDNDCNGTVDDVGSAPVATQMPPTTNPPNMPGPTTGNPTTAPRSRESTSSGCSVLVGREHGAAAWLALGLVGLGLSLRRFRNARVQ